MILDKMQAFLKGGNSSTKGEGSSLKPGNQVRSFKRIYLQYDINVIMANCLYIRVGTIKPRYNIYLFNLSERSNLIR